MTLINLNGISIGLAPLPRKKAHFEVFCSLLEADPFGAIGLGPDDRHPEAFGASRVQGDDVF